MTYNDVKSKIDACHKEILAEKSALRRYDEDYTSCQNALNSAEITYQQNLRQEKENALNSQITTATAQFDQKIADVKDKLKEEEDNYKAKLEKIDKTDITDTYSNEEAITAEVRASLTVLQDQLDRAISPRFQHELRNQLDSQCVEIKPEDVDNIIKYFNKQSTTLASLSGTNKVNKFIEWVLANLKIRVPEINDKRKQQLSYGLISLLLFLGFLLFSKYIFPVYVIILFLLLAFNVNRNYKIFSVLMAQKVVSDNLDAIDANLRDKAEKQLKEYRDSIDKTYRLATTALQEELTQLEVNKDNCINETKRNFVFDEASSLQKYQNARKINNSRLEEIKEKRIQHSNHLQELQEQLKTLQQDLNKIAGNLQDSFLDFNKAGTDIILDNKFIVDIKNARPVYFTHPLGGTVFLYDSIDEVINFIKLLIVQLRVKLLPTSLQCCIVDMVRLGISFLPFVIDNAEGANKQLFKIISDKKECEEHLEYLGNIVDKRLSTIRKMHPNINSYNEDMLESDSLPEAYCFSFLIDPETSLLSNKNFEKIYTNGSTIGVNVHVFMKNQDFYNANNVGRNLIERSSGIYVIKDGAILKRAKEYAFENLIKASNEKPQNTL